MDANKIINFFTACFRAGKLHCIEIPVSYYGRLYRMRDFSLQPCGSEMCLCMYQDFYEDGEWEDCNGEWVFLNDYDPEYLANMYRSFCDKVNIDKNLF